MWNMKKKLHIIKNLRKKKRVKEEIGNESFQLEKKRHILSIRNLKRSPVASILYQTILCLFREPYSKEIVSPDVHAGNSNCFFEIKKAIWVTETKQGLVPK